MLLLSTGLFVLVYLLHGSHELPVLLLQAVQLQLVRLVLRLLLQPTGAARQLVLLLARLCPVGVTLSSVIKAKC